MSNYTKEETANIVNKYTEALKAGIDTATAVKNLATDTGKSPAMIRSKLVAEKVYVAVAKPETAVKTVVHKIDLVKALEKKTGLDSLISLEKATKADLEALLAFLNKESE